MNHKMNYKIFQICFEPRQLELVQSPLTPFDNTSNERPELREYHSFFKALEQGVTEIVEENGVAHDLDAWGFLGPRWEAKLRYSAEDIVKEIEGNKTADVWVFNHARTVNALTYNVWEQGEYFHKGIRLVARTALEIAGYDSTPLHAFMTEANTGYCSYFVARKSFWNEYLYFLIKIKEALEKLPEDVKNIYESSANYSRDASLNMFPFIIERMFSTFLILNHDKFKVHSKPYDYSVYKSEVGDFVEVLDALNKMKTYIVKHDSAEVFDQWNAIRMHFVKTQQQLFNLD